MPDSTTTNYSYTKPEEFASTDTWGGKLNTNLDDLDTDLKAVSDVANAAALKTTALQSTDGSLSGVGDLSANRDLSVVANKTNQKVAVSKAGSAIGTRKEINFIDGAFITVTPVDDAGNDRVNVTITGADSEAAITESLATMGKAASINRSVFSPVFLTTTPAVIATVPAGRNCIRPVATVTNNSATEEGFEAWAVPNAGSRLDANKIRSTTIKIPPGRQVSLFLDSMFILDAGGTVHMASETGSTTLSVRLSMETVPTSNAAFIVGTPALLTTSLVTQHTVTDPTTRVAWVAHNYHATLQVGVTVAYRPSGAGSDSGAYNVAYDEFLLDPGESIVYDEPDFLAAGDLIRASASHASRANFRCSVAEIA